MNKKNDYVDLFLPEHHKARSSGNVHEHIVVAEEKLGRKLKEEEVVHHEDEDKSNNSPNNLLVFKTKADHSRYHHTYIKEKENDYWISPPQKGSAKNPFKRKCKVCGIHYNTIKETSLYCSDKCLKYSTRKTKRPSKDELYNLLKTNPFTKVGKMYGVSDNAIRKWCKSYKIPSNSKYYRTNY